MRTIVLISAAALALAACNKGNDAKGAGGTAVASSGSGSSSAAAVVAAMPKRKAGLWVQTMSHDGKSNPIGAMKLCIDAASDAQMSLLSGKMMDKTPCQTALSRGLDGSLTYTASCKMGESGMMNSKGTISGDFTSSYKVHSEHDITGGAVAAMNGHHVMDIEATYAGPCPAGMNGGDVMLANGMTFNAAKMAAMTGASGAAKQ